MLLYLHSTVSTQNIELVDAPALPAGAGIPPAPPASSAAAPGSLSSCRADAGSPGLLAFVDALSKGTAKGDLLEDLVDSPFAAQTRLLTFEQAALFLALPSSVMRWISTMA